MRRDAVTTAPVLKARSLVPGTEQARIARVGDRQLPVRRRHSLEAEQLGQVIVDAIVSKMGEDVLLLDIRSLSSFADYFVICSGASERQLNALAEEVRVKTRADGVSPVRSEGSPASGWMLLDYGSVVVHIFSPPTRKYYNIEQLWKDARTVVRLL